ncbi:hypothetical protein SAY87_015028 [Trapa incisa]|uniref:Uncharacterized protein n=1 Tax=Trapa incisa TaxID=236973 RepID=A0AAN7GX22_9MYRT|nr:hypothetical protein SAY87_015028 [Trapa incisa]
METLNLPKVKYSAKGKVLMRALYGVKVQTLFICSAFVVLFSGSSKKLFELDIPNTYQWAEDFNHLRGIVNGMIRRNQQSSQNNSLMKELLDIDTAVEKLCPLMLDGSMSRKEYPLQISVRQLKTDAEKFSSGLNLLMKEVDRFFHVVLTGRDALLSHLRAMCTATDSAERKTLGQLVL